MKLRPVGPRVLVKVKVVEKKTEGGIVLPEKMVQDESRKQQTGEVISVGKGCWKDRGGNEKATVSDNITYYEKTGESWCEIGEVVLFPSYAGMRIPDNDGGYYEDLILLNDQDITAVIEEE